VQFVIHIVANVWFVFFISCLDGESRLADVFVTTVLCLTFDLTFFSLLVMAGKRGIEILFFVVDDKFFSNVFMDMPAMNGD
jgi:hypothetical protein